MTHSLVTSLPSFSRDEMGVTTEGLLIADFKINERRSTRFKWEIVFHATTASVCVCV